MRRSIWLVLLSAWLWASSASMVQAENNVWTNIGLKGISIQAMAINPSTPTTLYAGTDGHGVYKSTNGGSTWNFVNTGLTNLVVRALALDPTTPTTLYAGTESGVFKSTNGGSTWSPVNTGLTTIFTGLDLVVRALALDPTTPTTLYTSIYNGGVFKSTNGGSTWNPAGSGSPFVYTLALDPTTPTTLYAGNYFAASGISKSTNGGSTWNPINTGLPIDSVYALALDPATPTTLYAGTRDGSVFKSTNGGSTWNPINTGLPTDGDSVFALAVAPTIPTTLYAGTFRSGVFKNTNGGSTWNPINTGLQNPDILTFALDPTTPTTLYAGTEEGGVFIMTFSPPPPPPSIGIPFAILRASVASDGTQGNDDSGYVPSLSADGRFVAFRSDATNLVPGDTNRVSDIFVYERQTGTTTRVSVTSTGAQGNGPSGRFDSPSLSADGRFVAFTSAASNLVPGDTNGESDVFVHDRQTGTTTRVSVASNGTQGNDDSGGSGGSSLSADGRFVAFTSIATNLVPGDTNDEYDVFVHDRQTGATTRVSVASDGTQGNGISDSPSLSADGRFVAFRSNATNLVPGDTNKANDIFVHDRQTGVTTRESVDSAGRQRSGACCVPSLSADGRFVAFAGNLDADESATGEPATGGLYVHDRQTGTNTRVSRVGSSPSLSADGRFVAFMGNLGSPPLGNPGYTDVFVHDRQTGTTTPVSVASDGTRGNDHSGFPGLSADGRFVAFRSNATNLVLGDTNRRSDVFLVGPINDTALGGPLVANAGPDQTVDQRTPVTLDGRGSSAPDGGALTFAWTQSAGPSVTLSSATAAQPTFTAPEVTAPTVLTFQLVVNAGTVNSAPDTVAITVRQGNRPPVANAGPDQTVDQRTPVTLDGRGSSAPDGASLTFAWTQTAGPSVTLSSTTMAQPTFTAPEIGADTVLTFQLVVNAGTVASNADTVNITVRHVTVPPTPSRGGGGGGGCAMNLGAGFDPTLVSVVGLLLAYLGWKRAREALRGATAPSGAHRRTG